MSRYADCACCPVEPGKPQVTESLRAGVAAEQAADDVEDGAVLEVVDVVEVLGVAVTSGGGVAVEWPVVSGYVGINTDVEVEVDSGYSGIDIKVEEEELVAGSVDCPALGAVVVLLLAPAHAGQSKQVWSLHVAE